MIKKEIFDLTNEQIELTKMFYDGKIIKCLVAPYHTAEYFEKFLEYSDNIFVFPENTVPRNKLNSFISMIINSPKYTEAIIITVSNEIITQMIGDNVRVFTESGKIVDCPIKCLMANIHDIRYSLLENKDFQDANGTITTDNFGTDFINLLIEELNNVHNLTPAQYQTYKNKIDLVGEPIIKDALLRILNNK